MSRGRLMEAVVLLVNLLIKIWPHNQPIVANESLITQIISSDFPESCFISAGHQDDFESAFNQLVKQHKHGRNRRATTC